MGRCDMNVRNLCRNEVDYIIMLAKKYFVDEAEGVRDFAT